jgi:hypothetical protein
MTYDREVIKMDKDILFGLNTNNYDLAEVKRYAQKHTTPKQAPAYYAPFDSRYDGGGNFALIDGIFGSLEYDDGKWQGYRDNGLDIVIDLGQVKNVSSVTANFLQNHEGWTFLPKSFQVLTSTDMKEFTPRGTIEPEIPSEYQELAIKQLSIENIDVDARYVRVKANTIGPAPQWLEAANGRPTWIFIDELIIK